MVKRELLEVSQDGKWIISRSVLLSKEQVRIFLSTLPYIVKFQIVALPCSHFLMLIFDLSKVLLRCKDIIKEMELEGFTAYLENVFFMDFQHEVHTFFYFYSFLVCAQGCHRCLGTTLLIICCCCCFKKKAFFQLLFTYYCICFNRVASINEFINCLLFEWELHLSVGLMNISLSS